MAEDDRWLLSAWAQALAAQAADLHLASGQIPLMRCRGQLVPLPSGTPCPAWPWPGLAAYFSDASAQRLLQGQTAWRLHIRAYGLEQATSAGGLS